MLRITWALALMSLFLSPATSRAGWPFMAEGGVRRGSAEYYEMRANEPPGTRQVYKYGKLWPPVPRPTGPHQTFVHKYYDTHYWPLPYQCDDRNYVANLYELQRTNGWQTATTLYDYHFDPQTNELNSAGQHHVRWILAHVPDQYRQAFVAASSDSTLNGVRLLSVEREVGKMVGSQQMLPVALRVADPVGRPATEVQQIFTQALEAAPQPSITYTSATGGGGGGGGN